MILYVNGDSHTAGAEAVNTCAFAEDDWEFQHLGRLPHPHNLDASWGKRLSMALKAGFHCDAESASSNDRIVRTTRNWITAHKKDLDNTLMIIQWSTWERREWLIDGTWYQINASGIDHVPESHQQAYKEYISTLNWYQEIERAHDLTWSFHNELNELGIKHVFFNGNNHFGSVEKSKRKDWGINYIEPYDPSMTYNQWLRDNEFETVSPDSWHFGKEAHASWSSFMLKYIIKNNLVN